MVVKHLIFVKNMFSCIYLEMFQEVETEPTLTEMSEPPPGTLEPVGGELADSEAQEVIQAIEPILKICTNKK